MSSSCTDAALPLNEPSGLQEWCVSTGAFLNVRPHDTSHHLTSEQNRLHPPTTNLILTGLLDECHSWAVWSGITKHINVVPRLETFS